MAASPESKAKKRILDALQETCSEYGWILHYETHAGDAFSTPTLDITGTIRHSLSRTWGIPFSIEVKRFDGKGKLTDRQRKTMRDHTLAGVAVFLIDDEASLQTFLLWIKTGCSCPLPPCTAGI